MEKQKRGFFVGIGYLVLFVIIFALALGLTFELGINIGKKRLIKEEMEAINQSSTPAPLITKAIDNTSESVDKGSDVSQTKNDTPTSIPVDNQPSKNLVENKTPQTSETTKSDYIITPRYTVQVGVFSSRQNAEKLANMLNAYEYDSWVMSKTDSQQTLHFVFNGRFEIKEDAEKFGKMLKERLTFINDYKIKKLE